MSKALRGGHSLDIQGAVGIDNEVTEDRKITAYAVKLMQQEGETCYDLSPINSGTSANDLIAPLKKAHDLGVDYFASIHLNASNGQGHGCEVLYKTEAEKIIAQRIVNKLASLGFTNRGVKLDDRGLFEFNASSNLTNNIIEPFFCDNTDDIAIYNQVGHEKVAQAIVEGILNKSVSRNGWFKESGFWYCYENGSKITNAWRKDTKDWCYLNENGQALVNGWAKDSTGKWCYCGDDCRIVRDKAITWNGKEFYFGKDGYWNGL